ncbi:hypothetical protein CASFOL_031076 [Castilleja foliolosa]|uniref:GDSL esterase/lipase n=1 Tax=Castilleja foliolosa TaxID=1961234 RepID=A0ABD3C4N1_9LAMI
MALYSTTRRILLSCMFLSAIFVPESYAKCAFEAVFNFGDSNSDTGGFFYAFPSQPSPNGVTYFKRPTGRTTDGRLHLDFLTQALGLPFLSPYLQSIGSDYKHGVNFATSASPVIQPNISLFVNGVSPFYLDVQINQMKHFKAKVEEFKSHGKTNLPQPDIFGKALYTIWIGQHDITYDIVGVGAANIKQYEPQIASGIANAVKELYRLGGRTFFVLNLAPIGCYGAVLTQVSHDNSDIDPSGCMISFNNAVREYNSVLKETLQQTRQELHDANVIYIDAHSVILELYQNPTAHGLQHGITACCGYGGGNYNFHPKVFCGNTNEVDGQKVTATACDDPQNYVSWDGIHLTESANKILANAIISGSNNEPSFNLNQFCDIQPIG